MRKTLVCVSVYGRDEEELGRRVSAALQQGADLAEARLDLTNITNWDRVYAILKPYADRLILTLRPVGEGGKSTLSDGERIELLEKLAGMGAAYVDVELKAVGENVEERLRKLGCRLIVSWHSFETTPETSTLVNMAEQALKHGDIAKIVTFSTSVEHNFRIISLYTYLPCDKLVAFCMGEKGMITRLLSMAAGAPIAYASLDDAETAPGQLPLSKMLETRKRILEGR
ncbi:MAG: type I 3-dehydroquinate dehydratase [Candidatus Caldarchaeum sp.]